MDRGRSWASAAGRLQEKSGVWDEADLTSDRGEKGSKPHVLSDTRASLQPVAVSGRNMHDNLALMPLILGIPAVRPAWDNGGADPSNSARTNHTCPPNTFTDRARAGSSDAPRSPAMLDLNQT
ncbi:hypothetical protein [Streptomyces sp. 1222.5]|uniref:hypothetical protein n=1 Tax=Streptomyces sp. 1222.5 TaxID=1881026 RepID=UPI003D74A1E9